MKRCWAIFRQDRRSPILASFLAAAETSSLSYHCKAPNSAHAYHSLPTCIIQCTWAVEPLNLFNQPPQHLPHATKDKTSLKRWRLDVLFQHSMTSSNIFSLPVPVYRQSKLPLRNGSPSRERKRKQRQFAQNDKAKSMDPSGETDQLQHVGSKQGSQFSEYSAVLTPDERSQYRVAGQPFDLNPPTKPFPHAPQSQPGDFSRTTESLSNRLANLDPPIYNPSLGSRYLPLHQQHLGAITALLHRALSEGDFDRAGRALSLILRDEVGGRRLDIRAEGRWGIGAEILLRQSTHKQKVRGIDRQNNAEDSIKSEQGPTWFTRKGFEDARRYYERLIVQYPFHKPNPGAVSALDFYPAMFGLWLYVVQEESKLHAEPLDDSTFSEMSQDEDSADPQRRRASILASKQRSLGQAREIADRMDACMTTIPYSDHFELIRLRSMVALWLADLIDDIVEKQSIPHGEHEGDIAQADVAVIDQFSRSPMQWSLDSPYKALRLEADRARQKSVEMQQKIQGHLSGLG
jgi:hypothetical protein